MSPDPRSGKKAWVARRRQFNILHVTVSLTNRTSWHYQRWGDRNALFRRFKYGRRRGQYRKAVGATDPWHLVTTHHAAKMTKLVGQRPAFALGLRHLVNWIPPSVNVAIGMAPDIKARERQRRLTACKEIAILAGCSDIGVVVGALFPAPGRRRGIG